MAAWVAQRNGNWSVNSSISTSPWYDNSTQSAKATIPVYGDTVKTNSYVVTLNIQAIGPWPATATAIGPYPIQSTAIGPYPII